MPTPTLMPMRRAAHRLLAPAAGWLALAATFTLPLPAAADPPHARAVAARQPAQADETFMRTLHSFRSTYDGREVRGKMTLAPDGYLYGTNRAYGSNHCGSAFKLSPAGVRTVIFEFGCGKHKGRYPTGDLLIGADGALYGTTSGSGPKEQGDIYRLTTDGKYTQLYALDPRRGDTGYPNAGLTLGNDGRFYGTTTSSVYAFDPATNGYTTLHRFLEGEGYGSKSPLTLGADGWFYGTLPDEGGRKRGTLYRIAPDGRFNLLHTFRGLDGDGANPQSQPVQAPNGLFYGTTYSGGTHGFGTVYVLDAAGVVKTLHSFASAEDGAHPTAPLLVAADGLLYGSAHAGGRNGLGTQFRISTAGVFETLHHFAGAPTDGAAPVTGFTGGADGALYAATDAGGAFDRGTIYKQDMAGISTTVHAFGSADFEDGDEPGAGLLLASDGMFYGSTLYAPGDGRLEGFYRISANGKYEFISQLGKPYEYHITTPFIEREPGEFVGVGDSLGSGFIFSMGADGVPRTLHRFAGGPNHGAETRGGLVKAGDGNIYGTTRIGGLYDRGTIYRMTPDNVVTVIHSFGNDPNGGGWPETTLVLGQDGALYGTAQSNNMPSSYSDVIFKITTAGVFTALYTLPAINPRAAGGLLVASNGLIYGPLALSTGNQGAIFSLSPAGEFKLVHMFSGSDGGGTEPQGPLMQARDGHLYGTTRWGGVGRFGTLYRLTLDGQFDVMYAFTGRKGANPNGSLVQGADNALYGTTKEGGSRDNNHRSDGTVFKLIGNFGPQK